MGKGIYSVGKKKRKPKPKNLPGQKDPEQGTRVREPYVRQRYDQRIDHRTPAAEQIPTRTEIHKFWYT